MTSPASVRRTSANGDHLVRGRFYLYNNLWGADTGSGSQCLWDASESDTQLAWGTEWNWSGREASIRSYAAAVLGWHWGVRVADTGLPTRLSAIRSARTSWTYRLTEQAPGALNVTYDLWLSDRPDLGNGNPAGEIMIWLHHTGGVRPIGSKRADLAVAGTEWALWEGPHPACGWPVWSFVRAASTDSASLDLVDFFHCLASQGRRCPDFLLSVEAGVEVLSGAGRLDTSAYSLQIEPLS